MFSQTDDLQKTHVLRNVDVEAGEIVGHCVCCGEKLNAKLIADECPNPNRLTRQEALLKAVLRQ